MDHKIIFREKRNWQWLNLKLNSKNLIINALGDLTYGELLVKELKKNFINLLPLKAQLLPEK